MQYKQTMVIIYLFSIRTDVSASGWKLRPQNHSIRFQGKHKEAKCCFRFEWNFLCLSNKGSCQRIRHMQMAQGPTPTLVGSKGVFVHPSYKRFLRELGNVANITIWSFIRVATVKSICDLLFKDLFNKPIYILGQKLCNVIRVYDILGKVSILKMKGMDKQMFLKVIWTHFFFFNGRYLEIIQPSETHVESH